MKEEFIEYLEQLKILSEKNDFLYAEEISEVESLIEDEEFNIVVVGEFSVGKSTFLNALMKKRILFSSNSEATGVATRIINSNEKKGRIIFNNENYEEDIINLNDKEAYRKLTRYLNRENSLSNTVRGVEIRYPIALEDSSIAILDTPGLAGLTLKEAEIAKKSMDISRMSIIVIGNQGIKQSEIDFLSGKNEVFGQLKTKENIVVINKVGEYFDKYTSEEAIEKIKRNEEVVKGELKKNEILNTIVLSVDSKDYLWACDSELYNEVSVPKLDKEEYKKRSNFNSVLKYINSVITDGGKEKILIEDIKEKINILLEAFKEEYKERNIGSRNSAENKMKNLKEAKFRLKENRKSIINTVKRNISKTTIDFSMLMQEEVKSDSELIKKEIFRKLGNRYIDEKIDKILSEGRNDNINIFVEEKVREFSKENEELFIKNSLKYTGKIDEYQKFILGAIAKLFEEKIKVVMEKTNLKIEFKFNEIVLTREKIKFQNKEEDFQVNSMKERVNKLIEEWRKEQNNLEKINGEIRVVRFKIEEGKRKNYGDKRQENEKLKDERKRRLGNRPEPKKIYKENKIEKRKFLFFKKVETVKEFKGFDYSECEKYDKDLENILEEYQKKDREIYRKLEEINELERIESRLKKNKKTCQLNEMYIKERLERETSNQKEVYEKYKNREIDKIKLQIQDIINKITRDNEERLERNLDSILSNISTKIKEAFEKQSVMYMEQCEINLEVEYENLKKKINDKDNVALFQIEEIEKNISKLNE